MSVFPCSLDTTRNDLLQHIHSWLEAELGKRSSVLRKISIAGRTVREFAVRERIENVAQPIPGSWYVSEAKVRAVNLRGCGVVLADRLVGGEERPYPLLAVIGGSEKELVVSLPRYAKGEPEETVVDNPQWQRLLSTVLSHVDWSKCVLSLQEAKLVEKERSAEWGAGQRGRDWEVKQPGTPEHELRVLLIGMHEDLLVWSSDFDRRCPRALIKTQDRLRGREVFHRLKRLQASRRILVVWEGPSENSVVARGISVYSWPISLSWLVVSSDAQRQSAMVPSWRNLAEPWKSLAEEINHMLAGLLRAASMKSEYD